MGVSKNSMLYWFPKLEEMGIPVPKTEFTHIGLDTKNDMWAVDIDKKEMKEAVEKVGGYPVFLRTDHISSKHEMSMGSRATGDDELRHCAEHLVEKTMMIMTVGLNVLAIREWIEINHYYRAFGFPHARDEYKTPIGFEMRYFIRDGEIECKHFYWVKGSIRRADRDNWKSLHDTTKRETLRQFEKDDVDSLVLKIAEEFKGYWSVDVAMDVDGNYYVIDMAEGEESYHKPECENAPDVMMRIYGNSEYVEEETDD